MFSLFPDLLDLYPFAALLLRVTAGYLFVLHGWRLYKLLAARPLGSVVRTTITYGLVCVQLIVGTLFILGVYVQGAALVGAVVTFFGLEAVLVADKTQSEREVYLLLCVISLALLFLGAGPFAFDLPL